jgi:pyruvate/2-oxoglutarate dehydrogenase complex dihydrolipoamide dehydrogenase (E3) component
MVKLVATRSGKLVGAGIAAPQAGEMLAPYVLAMTANLPVKTFAGAVFPYPTMAEAGKVAAVAFYKPKLTSGWVKLMVRALRTLG